MKIWVAVVSEWSTGWKLQHPSWFFATKHHLPIAGSEATPGDGIHVFPTPSAGQGGGRSWTRWVRWIFGKNQKNTGNFTGENGGNWESRLINYGILGLFTPQRCFWVANEQRFRLGDVLILLTFYYKNAMKSCFEAWNLGCTVIQMEEIWEGLFLTLGFFWTSLTRPTFQLLHQDKLPAIEDILLSHLPASTLVAERLWIVCSILADISNIANMSYSMKEFRVSSSVFFRIQKNR